jgi:glycosyltransferase involved in cell wall biosynthesis
MRVLHVSPSFAPAWRYGGPVQFVLRLCQALQKSGVEVEVATTNCDGRNDLDVPLDGLTTYEDVPVRYFRRWPRVDYAFSLPLFRFLAGAVPAFDVVHITSTFSFPADAAGRAARAAGVPYVISPHGSLQPWALRQKSWKKRPYWTLIEHANLKSAAAIHTTAETERTEVLRVLPHPNVIVIPNGMEPVPALDDVRRLPSQVVFLGRVHPGKGFDVLVPALSRVAREMPSVETIVAGPDDEGEWKRIESEIAKAMPRPRIRYVGTLHGPDRFRLLAQSAVFVLPSHRETFGMAVVEAMACGTPVVVSRNTPWEAVERAGAGEWVENTPEAVSAALLRLLRDPERAARMGESARRLAANYDWAQVGRQMKDLYESLTHRDIGRAGRTA